MWRAWMAAGRFFRAVRPNGRSWRWRQRWWLRQPWMPRILNSIVILLGLGLLLRALASVVSVFLPHDLPLLDHLGCHDPGIPCQVTNSIISTVAPLLIGPFLFVSFTLWRVRRPLLKAAKREPAQLVETAGQIIGDIVGRDDVCELLQQQLSGRKVRRPYVIVGGIGTGKTALLVRLTELLAKGGAVPVPIRVRDASADVDFLGLAKEKFLNQTQSSGLLASSAERAWDRLYRTGKIVVLADGLEEALANETNVDQERDHRVRSAVTHAKKLGYPLVIASREHEALSALDAALFRLEPLGPQAALGHIEDKRGAGDKRRLAWIIATAEVVTAPLYLQITRELRENDQLSDELETRGADRVRLRMNLAGAWVGAVIAGTLDKHPAPLSDAERKATVYQLAALACCGLAEDRIEVAIDRYEERGAPKLKAALEKAIQPTEPLTIEEIPKERDRRESRKKPHMSQPAWKVNMQVAASHGARLGLVERRGKGVRFPHGQMQAYLGSWLIGEALKDSDFVRRAFKKPGRELLIALVMFSRRKPEPEGPSAPDCKGRSLSWLSKRLCRAANTPSLIGVKRIEVLTAAVEVDSVIGASNHREALGMLVACWTQVSSWEDAPCDAKLLAVATVGCVARRLTSEEEKKEEGRRLASEKSSVDGDVKADSSKIRDVDHSEAEFEKALERSVESSPAYGFYLQLYKICCNEPNYRIRLAAAVEIGKGGSHAFEELEDAFRANMPEDMANATKGRRKQIGDPEKTLSDGENRYRYSAQAWLLPMLIGSGAGEEAKKLLWDWLQMVGDVMPPWLEAALAQGFKHAANQLPKSARDGAARRAHLVARAEGMLEKAEYWFSRLTLLHALGLWAISGKLYVADDEAAPRDPRQVVEGWIGQEPHRFVREAGRLVVTALETGHPERFIWVDESSVTTTVGSMSRPIGSDEMREMLISPSAGWLVLDREARQLVADVMILLTLAERGDRPEDWARNYDRINQDSLPDCLTVERTLHLRPTDTPGAPHRLPGARCKDGCPVKLCPYPLKGQKPYRVELSETFCRDQRELLELLSLSTFKAAAWQNAGRSELKKFWREMERRART